MTQQEHLTTEQLSAFLDKQLTAQEQAFFDAHLQSCQRCQHVLAELRGTIALLHAMPEPPLPHSFTIPAGVAQTPVTRPQPLRLPAQQRRAQRYMFQRTVRAISTLAAVIAVLFILSSLLPLLSFHGGGAASMTAGPANGSTYGEHQTASGTTATEVPHTQSTTPDLASHPTGTPKKSPPAATPASTPTPAPTSTSNNQEQGQSGPTAPPPPTLPPYLDISQPYGRLLPGAFLLLLSIVGLIATRRVRRRPWQQ